MKAWHFVLGIGFAASSLVAGCVVGSDDDDGVGGFPSGGEAGTAGSGGSTGGSGGSTGGSGGSTGGTTGGTGGATGGSGGTNFMCDPNANPTASCDECMQAKCCQDWEDCVNDPECLSEMNGTPSGELACISTCTDDVYQMNMDVTEADVASCVGMCATGGVANINAEALVTCIMDIPMGADASGERNCGLICLNAF